MGDSTVWVSAFALVVAACGDSSSTTDGGGRDGGGGTADAGAVRDAGVRRDGGSSELDGAAGGTADLRDSDGDGLPDSLDAFPDDPAEAYDSDGDRVGNVAQSDEDGDGVPDVDDALPFDPTASAQPVSSPGDLAAAPFKAAATLAAGGEAHRFELSTEEGGIYAALVSTSAGEAVPEVYFATADGERRWSLPTLGLLAPTEGAAVWIGEGPGPMQVVVEGASSSYDLAVFLDADMDLVDDDRELSLGSHPTDFDSDSDRVGDRAELQPMDLDPDGDGLINPLDRDSDGDGLADWLEGTGDVDGDGAPNFADTDANNNGVSDADELAGELGLRDHDGDGRVDVVDGDADGDGVADTI